MDAKPHATTSSPSTAHHGPSAEGERFSSATLPPALRAQLLKRLPWLRVTSCTSAEPTPSENRDATRAR